MGLHALGVLLCLICFELVIVLAILISRLTETFSVCRDISSDNYGRHVIFSVKLTLAMQIIGCTVRLSSSFLWIQIYRLGVSYVDTRVPREADFDLRNSFLNPATPAAVVRQSSDSDDILGGSIYDPAYYSSLFDGQDNRCSYGVYYS